MNDAWDPKIDLHATLSQAAQEDAVEKTKKGLEEEVREPTRAQVKETAEA